MRVMMRRKDEKGFRLHHHSTKDVAPSLLLLSPSESRRRAKLLLPSLDLSASRCSPLFASSRGARQTGGRGRGMGRSPSAARDWLRKGKRLSITISKTLFHQRFSLDQQEEQLLPQRLQVPDGAGFHSLRRRCYCCCSRGARVATHSPQEWTVHCSLASPSAEKEMKEQTFAATRRLPSGEHCALPFGNIFPPAFE